MKLNGNLKAFARSAAVTLAALTSSASVCAAGDFVYVQSTATSSYTPQIGPIPIPGLSLTLPAATTKF